MTSTQPETSWTGLRHVATARAEVSTRLRAHGPFAALLALTAVLYLWGLDRSGDANQFYAAAVKAGTQSWKAFLFGSLDSSNFITVDKPPASLWLMELSGRVFGFSTWSMLVPQALAGVASVALVYATVKRWFSVHAALLSGAILAVTPVAALMFRFNNPDALLVLLLVGAAYATTRAIEVASVRWLALAGAAVGFGFLTKMMEAFLIVPALALAYLVAAPGSLPRRAWHLVVAGLALVAAGGWWVAVVELTPASSRPYVGGSTNNSIFDLIWGYNGLGRLDGTGTGQGANFSGSPGLLRLFNSEMGGQISWLLPAALLGLVFALWHTARRPRVDRSRAALLIWGGWLVVTALVFSSMSGVIHPYYTNLLAPPIAVVVGVVVAELWSRRRDVRAAVALALMLIGTSAWSYVLLDRTPSWHPWLRDAVVAVGLLVAVVLVVARHALRRTLVTSLAVAGLAAALAAPVAYTLSTVATAETGSIVAAGPSGSAAGFGGGGRVGGGTTSSTALDTLIGASGTTYRWAAATSSSMTAAPLELATGKAVMAIGGFNGSDHAITLAAFKKLVAGGEVHYYVAGGGGFGGAGGSGAPGRSAAGGPPTGGPPVGGVRAGKLPSGAGVSRLGRGSFPGGQTGGPGGGNTEIATWVAAHFTATTVGGTTVYDLTQPK
jgi:4-amino-4-deoxy-L-arabinose transferase-like glycosyltransferase